MLDEDEVRRFSEVLRTLGEPTRLRILHALAASELCVFDLARGLGMSPSAISHQLRLLRALRMVRYRKQGREVYYALDDEHVLQLMSGVLSHLRHETRSS
jgi:ArsR family transcriptional regulator